MRLHQTLGLAVATALLLGIPTHAQVVIPGVPYGSLAVNPVTNKIYVGSFSTLTEVDGATHALRTVTGIPGVVVDPVQDRLWTVDYALDSAIVIEGTDLSMQSVPVGDGPRGMALDPAANVIWVLNSDGTATRIDGTDLSADPIPLGIATTNARIVADPIGGRAFVSGPTAVLEIDRETLSVETIPSGDNLGRGLAVNPATARVFTFTIGPYDPEIEDNELRLTRIDADANAVIGHTFLSYYTLFPLLHRLASDPVHGRIWYEHSKTDNSVQARVEADGSFAMSAATDGGGSGSAGWAMNPASNRLYQLGGFAAPPQWRILDADSGTSSFEYLSPSAADVAVNPATSLSYRSMFEISPPFGAWLVETPEPETTPVPITTAISNDPPAGGSVVVHFDATSAFAPIAPPIQRIFYRVDGTSGAWTAASPAGASASATLSLAPGSHTVHAFAVDGQEATIGYAQRTTPIVGQVASLEITIPAPPACSNGVDDDGDTLADYPADPGCKSAAGMLENPQCDNGVDDDGDLAIDHPADTLCRARWDNDEASNPSCGFGAELALALALLTRARRRSPA